MRLISYAVFLGYYLPVYLLRRLRSSSPFDGRAHHAESAWDL